MPPSSSNWRKAEPATSADNKRDMNMIASVSRSSGLERGGDDLKDFAIQEEYLAFIQNKTIFITGKLREGISASKRSDAFAVEVYETSLFLAITSGDHRRISPIISQVTPALYADTSGPHAHAALALTASLLYHLVTAFPSQMPFQQHLAAVTGPLLPRDSPSHRWIKALAASLRQRNYARFSRLTSSSEIPFAFDGEADDLGISLGALSLGPRSSRAMALRALRAVIGMLREKVRSNAWAVLRAAYKELSSTAEGAPWLARALALEQDAGVVARWLNAQEVLGRVRRKEGVEGRWLTCTS
ncbi:hypothetical protein HDZ31DRAFT_84255 [Schizophyllum fasciatum]